MKKEPTPFFVHDVTMNACHSGLMTDFRAPSYPKKLTLLGFDRARFAEQEIVDNEELKIQMDWLIFG